LVGAGCLVAALGVWLRLKVLAREKRSAQGKAQRSRSAR